MAFENKNSDLRSVNSTYAFLFGIRTNTDTMNSLEGPLLGQVFPSDLFDDVIANLTNQSKLFAELHNVPVLSNSYFGIDEPYILEYLLIVANQRSEVFLDEFADSSIRARLDPRWPNRFEVAMPTLDANTLCVFNGWKVNRLRKQLTRVFL